MSVGAIPDGGGTQRCPRLIGLKAALDLLISGRTIGTDEALKLRLIDRVIMALDYYGRKG